MSWWSFRSLESQMMNQYQLWFVYLLSLVNFWVRITFFRSLLKVIFEKSWDNHITQIWILFDSDGGLSQYLLGWGGMCSYWLLILGGLSEDFVGYTPYFSLPRPTPVQGMPVFWGWSSEEQSYHDHSSAPHLGVATNWDWGDWVPSCACFWESSSQRVIAIN